jgi:hypothetical protein
LIPGRWAVTPALLSLRGGCMACTILPFSVGFKGGAWTALLPPVAGILEQSYSGRSQRGRAHKKACTTDGGREDKPQARYGHWKVEGRGGIESNARRFHVLGKGEGAPGCWGRRVMHVVEVVCISAGRSQVHVVQQGLAHMHRRRCASLTS